MDPKYLLAGDARHVKRSAALELPERVGCRQRRRTVHHSLLEHPMALLAEAPAALRCPRCSGPMFPQAAGDLDYLCLMCGEYRFLVRQDARIQPLPPEELKPRRRGRPKRYGY